MALLVCYIPTPEGEAALDWSLAHALDKNEELFVLNVSRGEAVLEARRVYDDQARELEKRLVASGVTYTLRRVTHSGDAADQVLAVAKEIDPEQIVIGLRKRSMAGKVLWGSTAQRIMLHADHPVTAVKAAH